MDRVSEAQDVAIFIIKNEERRLTSRGLIAIRVLLDRVSLLFHAETFGALRKRPIKADARRTVGEVIKVVEYS